MATSNVEDWDARIDEATKLARERGLVWDEIHRKVLGLREELALAEARLAVAAIEMDQAERLVTGRSYAAASARAASTA